MRSWFRVRRIRRHWKAAARGARYVSNAIAPLPREERRRIMRDMVAGRAIPAEVIQAAKKAAHV